MQVINHEAVVGRIIDRVKEVFRHSDAERSVLETARHMFGEDNVDLQFNDDLYAWVNFFADTSTLVLQESNGLPEMQEFEPSSDHILACFSILPARIDDFLGSITMDFLSGSNWPVSNLLIRFRDFTVANEKGESTTIEEMFAKVRLTSNGSLFGNMSWSRTVYSLSHWVSQYAHSHLNGMTIYNGGWQIPCLGTGPIRMTMQTLRTGYDRYMWLLFMKELDLCIRTESLAGGPYVRISSIRSGLQVVQKYKDYADNMERYGLSSNITIAVMKEALESGKLLFLPRNGRIMCANDFIDLSILLTNTFMTSICRLMDADGMEWEAYSGELERYVANGTLFIGQVVDNCTIIKYKPDVVLENNGDEEFDAGFMFNGIPVKIRKTSDASITDLLGNARLFLRQSVVSWFRHELTKLANYVYTASE